MKLTPTTRLYATFTPYIMALLGLRGAERSINWTYYRTLLARWVAGKLRGVADKLDTPYKGVEETVTVTVLPTVTEKEVEFFAPAPCGGRSDCRPCGGCGPGCGPVGYVQGRTTG